ncbi:MAG TPA: efflux RND transporter periplasmic adaptor subunit [Gallionellaceae bacterium]|nr:efflux RND transporter periplasmic adaptor subunit [Gallionellaceae bacterium]
MIQKILHSKKLLFGLVAAGLVVAGIFWWAMPRKISAADRYVTASVERGAIAQTVSANGTLNPVVLVSVGSQVSGIVKALHADFNNHVKKGQVLLELDPTLLRAQLTQSEATLASARASYLLARENEKRSRDLYAKQFVTRQDLDTAVQALDAAKAQVELATAQVKHDRTNLDYTVIRSPVSGVVVSRVVDVGQTVAASFQTPTLFTIAKDLSQMQIDSSYAEADVGSIREGQEANFTVDAFPNRSFRGVVRQVRLNPTTVQNVVTYDVVVGVNNADQVLMPGMTAYVNITVARRNDALLVPNAALRFHPTAAELGKRSAAAAPHPKQESEGGGPTSTVYVIDNNQLKAVRIKTGITDNRMIEVLGGDLKAGEKVVVMDRQSSGTGGENGHRPRFF